MKIVNRIRKLPAVLIFIIVIVAIVLLVKLILFLSKAFVYLGFNLFLYLDNLLKFQFANPLIMWGILGLFLGSIIGVMVAMKKYKLPKKLVIFPISATVLLIVILSFVNKPADLSGSFTIPISSTPETIAPVSYSVIQPLNVRSRPSARGTKLFTLPQGAHVQILENVNDEKNIPWSKIQYTNPQTGYPQTGYVNSKYLKSY